MNLSKKSIFRRTAVLTFAGMIAMSAAVPAFAQEDITQGITAGTFTGAAGLSAAPTFAAVETSFLAQDSQATNTPTFTVEDGTGETAGWTVTMESSPLTHSASVGVEYDLPATAVTATVLGTTTLSNGASATGLTAPTEALTIGAEGGQTVMGASATNGQGTYVRAVTLSIALPANVHVGTYSGTITTTTTQIPT